MEKYQEKNGLDQAIMEGQQVGVDPLPQLQTNGQGEEIQNQDPDRSVPEVKLSTFFEVESQDDENPHKDSKTKDIMEESQSEGKTTGQDASSDTAEGPGQSATVDLNPENESVMTPNWSLVLGERLLLTYQQIFSTYHLLIQMFELSGQDEAADEMKRKKDVLVDEMCSAYLKITEIDEICEKLVLFGNTDASFKQGLEKARKGYISATQELMISVRESQKAFLNALQALGEELSPCAG